MKNFRTHSIAVEFYRLARSLKLQWQLKNQLIRAASSIALNLAEGSGRPAGQDQMRFYQYAFASMRECQSVLELEGLCKTPEWECLDKLAAHLYKLVYKRE